MSHRSAAAHWRLRPSEDGPISVTIVGSDRGRKRAGIELHRASELHRRDVQIHHRLPVTSPARTLLDYAAVAGVRETERALDEGLAVLKLVRPEELRDVMARAPSHKDARTLKMLLEHRGPSRITQSEAKRLFLELIREARLPIPETQVRIAGYTVDFYWPQHKVAFEIDGYRFHTSRSAFDRDRTKDAAVKAAGVDPNRVSRDQVKLQPLPVVGYVAFALGRATR